MEALYVVGAGGIGCTIGYALAAVGSRVTFVDADVEKVRWGQAHGVCVDQLPPQTAEFLHFEDWHPAPGSTVLLCTKCYDNDAVLRRLPVSVTLLPIQNGFDRVLEGRHAWEGIASFVSECLPGRTHTRITRRGRLHFGPRRLSPSLQEGGRNHAPEVMQRVRSGAAAVPGVRVEFVPEILPFKYTKLMYNAAISPLAAAAGIDNGRLLSYPRARRLFFHLLRENYAILHGAGVTLGKIGPFHPDTVQRILARPAVARALSWAFYPSLRGTYCSMSGDLPKGRTEIEYYNGHLIECAGDRPCPWNRAAYDLVRRMERDSLPPTLVRLEEMEEQASVKVPSRT